MRTIDIPPSRIEPQERLELELPAPDAARQRDGVETIEPPEVAGEPRFEQRTPDPLAAAEAAALRAANAAQLLSAQAQLEQITADRAAQQDRLARYRDDRAAHAAAMSDYERQLAAARADRERWEADVAACRAGDRLRCSPRDGRR